MATDVTTAIDFDKILSRCRRDQSGCLLYGTGTGYAHAKIDGRWAGLHRLALELRVGAKFGLRRGLPLPPGRMALHRPTCVGRRARRFWAWLNAEEPAA